MSEMHEFNNTAINESSNTDCIYFNECYLQLRNNGYCFSKCKDFHPQLYKESNRRERDGMNERAKFLKTNNDQDKRIDEIREQFSNLYDYIEKNCKPSRETSLVFTKLEEAQFWAIKGITREDK